MNIDMVPVESKRDGMCGVNLVDQVISVLFSACSENGDLKQFCHFNYELLSIRADQQLHSFGIEVNECLVEIQNERMGFNGIREIWICWKLQNLPFQSLINGRNVLKIVNANGVYKQ